MNDDDKFFFDLKGFVHLKGVLSQEEVDRCNAAIDAHADRFFHTERTLEGDSKVLGGTNKQKWMEGMLEWERPHCEPFRDLLVHAKIQPYLNELLGGGYRLDHGPLLIAMDKGDGGHYLHGGGVERQDFSQTYTFKYGQMFCGLTAVEFQLADEGTRIPQSQFSPAREAVPVRRTPRVRQRGPQPSRRRHYLHRSTDPRHASMAGRTPAPLADLQVQSIFPSPRARLPSDASSRLHPRHERRRTRHAQLGAASSFSRTSSIALAIGHAPSEVFARTA
ncbi:MAG: hypothetical protein J4F35_07900 [Candidatus Latescibacteria bacterium]|nr:hypothetical protein [Candidatus Latescibacterota bacterium]